MSARRTGEHINTLYSPKDSKSEVDDVCGTSFDGENGLSTSMLRIV